MIVAYLTVEREFGRIGLDADIDTLAPMLIGTAHLLFAGRHDPPQLDAVHRVVSAVMGGCASRGAVTDRPIPRGRRRRGMTESLMPRRTARRHPGRLSWVPATGGGHLLLAA